MGTTISGHGIAPVESKSIYKKFIDSICRKLSPIKVVFVVAGMILFFGGGKANAQIITTVAGNNTPYYSGDGGAATAAAIGNPLAVALDASGNLYIADYTNSVVRMVNSSGIIATVAGNGGAGYTGDGGPSTTAEIGRPYGLALDSYGNLYISDFFNSVVREVNTSGIITTFAGTTSGYSGDGGPATNAQLWQPTGLAFDAYGDLYISENQNEIVRKVNTSGIITTVAGTPPSGGTFYPGYSGDGGAATAAELYGPWGLCFDASGNLYIGDWQNAVVRKVDLSGIITTYAGVYSGIIYGGGGCGSFYCGDGGPATDASIDGVAGIAFDVFGDLFICDDQNNVIRMVNTSGIIYTVAGNGYGWGRYTGGYSGDGGPATAAELYNPCGIVMDNLGNGYIADFDNDVVRAFGSTAFLCRGSTLTFTTDLSGTWSSSNTSIATVGSTGLVSGIATGTATISLGSLASISITVLATPDAISGMGPVCAGSSILLTDATSGGTWSSSDNTLGSIGEGSGELTGIAAGNPVISYTGSDGCYAATTATVNPLPDAISGSSYVCLNASITLSDGTSGGRWSSSDPATGSVSTLGVVQGVSPGSTIITYKLNATGCYVTTEVAVEPIISGPSGTCVGASITLSGWPSGGTWSCLSTFVSIGSSSGVVSGSAPGTATITYTDPDGCSGYDVLSFLTALPPVYRGTPPYYDYIFGFCVVVGSAPEFMIALGDPITGGVWTSSNTSVIEIGSSSALLTGVSVGTAYITYTVGSGCFFTQTISTEGSCITRHSNPAAVPAAPIDVKTISIVPNPNTGVFSLVGDLDDILSQSAEECEVDILNILGQKVAHLCVPIADSQLNSIVHLDANIEAGVYFVRIRSGDRVKVLRFLLSR